MVGITGFTEFSGNPGSGDVHQTAQFSDTLTWSKGSHFQYGHRTHRQYARQ